MDGAALIVSACELQAVYHTILLTHSHISSPPSHPRSPIPPHYILLALCLLARPFARVFRVQCFSARVCVRRQTFDSSSDATPCARRSSFGLSRLAVLCCLSHTLFASSIAPAALLDSAWHRLLLHREPGAVVVVVLSSTRTARHFNSYTTQHEG